MATESKLNAIVMSIMDVIEESQCQKLSKISIHEIFLDSDIQLSDLNNVIDYSSLPFTFQCDVKEIEEIWSVFWKINVISCLNFYNSCQDNEFIVSEFLDIFQTKTSVKKVRFHGVGQTIHFKDYASHESKYIYKTGKFKGADSRDPYVSCQVFKDEATCSYSFGKKWRKMIDSGIISSETSYPVPSVGHPSIYKTSMYSFKVLPCCDLWVKEVTSMYNVIVTPDVDTKGWYDLLVSSKAKKM